MGQKQGRECGRPGSDNGQRMVGLSNQGPSGPPMGQNLPWGLHRACRPSGHQAAALPSAPLQHACAVYPGCRKPACLPPFGSSGAGGGGLSAAREETCSENICWLGDADQLL